MEKTYLVPHFHGFSFNKEGLTSLEEKMDFFNLLKGGQIEYYNQMVLKNAVVDYTTLEYKWRKKLLDDFYLKDLKEILETQIDDFYEFWQAYINTYKTDNKELYSKIQKKLKNTKYRDYLFLNPELKEWIPLLAEYRKRTKCKKYTEQIKQEYKRAIEAIQEYKEQKNYSPFVAMSKLPRHAIKFALSDLLKMKNINFTKFRNEEEVFLGAVLITLDKPNLEQPCKYINKAHYDVLKNVKSGNLKIHPHYKKQTEVDFLKIQPILIFPIYKPAINKDWKQNFEQKYISQKNYINLKKAISKIQSFGKMQDKLSEAYQEIITEYILSFVQKHYFELCYQAPDNIWYEFTNNIMDMQSHIVEKAKKNTNKSQQKQIIKCEPSQEIQNMLHELEALAIGRQLEEVFSALKKEINQCTSTQEAIKKLAEKEKEGMEQYETVALDRFINLYTLKNPEFTRIKRDEELANALRKFEKARKQSFIQRLQQKRNRETRLNPAF